MPKIRLRHAAVLAVVASVGLPFSACAGEQVSARPTETTSPPAGDDLAPPSSTTTVPDEEPTKVLVVGDSVMLQIGVALEQWSAAHPGRMEVRSEAHIGCGTTRGGLKRYEEGTGDNGAVCATWADRVDPSTVADGEVISWITAVETYRPDVVLGRISAWDSLDRLVPALGDRWMAPGDPTYDAFVAEEYGAALQVLSSTGATVAWLVEPFTNHPGPYSDPARLTRMDEVVMPLVEALPRHQVIDFRGWLGVLGGERDLAFRPDGEHIAEDHFEQVAEWLAPQLEDSARVR